MPRGHDGPVDRRCAGRAACTRNGRWRGVWRAIGGGSGFGPGWSRRRLSGSGSGSPPHSGLPHVGDGRSSPAATLTSFADMTSALEHHNASELRRSAGTWRGIENGRVCIQKQRKYCEWAWAVTWVNLRWSGLSSGRLTALMGPRRVQCGYMRDYGTPYVMALPQGNVARGFHECAQGPRRINPDSRTGPPCLYQEGADRYFRATLLTSQKARPCAGTCKRDCHPNSAADRAGRMAGRTCQDASQKSVPAYAIRVKRCLKQRQEKGNKRGEAGQGIK